MFGTYCNEPWRTVHYDGIGKLGPCCTFRGERPDSNTVDEYLNSEWLKNLKRDLLGGIQHPGCFNCWRKEDRGEQSQRTEKLLKHGFVTEGPIRELFLSFGNICNKACNICRPQRSSLIAKEHKQVERDSVYWRYRYSDNPKWLSKDFSGMYLDKIEDYYTALSSADVIIFDGGEPFITRQCDLILDYMLDNDMTDKHVKAVTNGSVRQDQLDKLSQFNKCSFHLSIDGVDDLYEFVRPPHSWEWWCEQHDRIKSYSVNLTYACVVHAFNIHQLGSILDYFLDQNAEHFYFSAINDQDHLLPIVVPDTVLNTAIDELESRLSRLNSQQRTNIENTVNYLKNGLGEDTGKHDVFKDYCRQFSRIKNINHGDYIPWINQ